MKNVMIFMLVLINVVFLSSCNKEEETTIVPSKSTTTIKEYGQLKNRTTNKNLDQIVVEDGNSTLNYSFDYDGEDRVLNAHSNDDVFGNWKINYLNSSIEAINENLAGSIVKKEVYTLAPDQTIANVDLYETDGNKLNLIQTVKPFYKDKDLIYYVIETFDRNGNILEAITVDVKNSVSQSQLKFNDIALATFVYDVTAPDVSLLDIFESQVSYDLTWFNLFLINSGYRSSKLPTEVKFDVADETIQFTNKYYSDHIESEFNQEDLTVSMKYIFQ